MTKNDLSILTVNDIQEIMGLGRDRAYRLMHSDGFPAVLVGRTAFVTVENFMEWMDDYTYKKFEI